MDFNKKVNKEVMFADKDHVWIDNRQYISLERFLTVKNDIHTETRLLNEKVRQLSEKVAAYETLLNA
nr:hypothetical protein [uncultured Mediterraneibacter sp.]